jgi:hypothetical protein
MKLIYHLKWGAERGIWVLEGLAGEAAMLGVQANVQGFRMRFDGFQHRMGGYPFDVLAGVQEAGPFSSLQCSED